MARVPISAAVEGILDETVARAVITSAGGILGNVYGKLGKSALRERIVGYNRAARLGPWLVLVDLDQDADCPAAFRQSWVPIAERHLCFRVAVRQIEAWLMADAETLSSFLGVAENRIPNAPEDVANSKEKMVAIASRSRRRAIREDMVPRLGSGRHVGPAYTSTLIEYAAGHWRPRVAAKRAESLRRAIRCLERLVE